MNEINNNNSGVTSWDKIRSKYILKEIYTILKSNRLLEIIRYNKNLKNKLNINAKDYIKEYSKIVIEIIPNEKNEKNDYNFINIKNRFKPYFHIFFNDNDNEEITRCSVNQKEKVTKIKIIIDYKIKSLFKLFKGCKCIKAMNIIKFNNKNIKNMSYMFSGCSSLKKLNLNKFITNKVINMSKMFYGCSSLEELNISSFNTSKVENMSKMFYGCSSLEELNISSFNTSKVENMSTMFFGCSSIKKLDLSNFNTNNVKNMNYMFVNCLSLKELNISNFIINNSVKIYNIFSWEQSFEIIKCSDELKKKLHDIYPSLFKSAPPLLSHISSPIIKNPKNSSFIMMHQFSYIRPKFSQ